MFYCQYYYPSEADAEEIGNHIVDVEATLGAKCLHALCQHSYGDGCCPHRPFAFVQIIDEQRTGNKHRGMKQVVHSQAQHEIVQRDASQRCPH